MRQVSPLVAFQGIVTISTGEIKTGTKRTRPRSAVFQFSSKSNGDLRRGGLELSRSHVEGDRLHVFDDGNNGFTELSRLKRNQATAKGAGKAKLFRVLLDEHLALAEAVVEILPWSHHVAQLTIAASFNANPPASLENEHPARRWGQIVIERVRRNERFSTLVSDHQRAISSESDLGAIGL
jgi:hypothetical protein